MFSPFFVRTDAGLQTFEKVCKPVFHFAEPAAWFARAGFNGSRSEGDDPCSDYPGRATPPMLEFSQKEQL